MASIAARVFTCDICRTTTVVEGRSVIETPSSKGPPEGWKFRHVEGDWAHSCPTCGPIFADFQTAMTEWHRLRSEVTKPIYARAHAVYQEADAAAKEWERGVPRPVAPWRQPPAPRDGAGA